MAGGHSEPRRNADPFHPTEGDQETSNWAQLVGSAEASASPGKEKSIALGKTETGQSERVHFAGLEAVRTATHHAKQKLHLDSIKASGPSKRFNPTNVRVHVKWADDDQRSSDDSSAPGGVVHERSYLWRSRDNRKGRNSISVPSADSPGSSTPFGTRLKKKLALTARNVWRMFFTFRYWDMAFWSGWGYTWGSVLFIMDGGWYVQSIVAPNTISDPVTTYGATVCFFIGALLYQVGATVAWFEALNDGSFQGSAMRRFLEGHEEDSKKMLDTKIHDFIGHLIPHHHRHGDEKDDEAARSVDPEAGWKAKDRKERPGSIYPTGKAPAPRRGGVDLGESEEGTSATYMTWRWWPTWSALRTHHVYELGWLACSIQLFGATLFSIAGVVNLPGILSNLQPWQEYGAYWAPLIFGSVCFLVAAFFFTLETQEKWWRPELSSVGWWIGFWAIIGSVGFLLSGIFGAMSDYYDWAELQSDVSSTWGSAAYLFSGMLQWYESINKNPVEEILNERGPLKSYQVVI